MAALHLAAVDWRLRYEVVASSVVLTPGIGDGAGQGLAPLLLHQAPVALGRIVRVSASWGGERELSARWSRRYDLIASWDDERQLSSKIGGTRPPPGA